MTDPQRDPIAAAVEGVCRKYLLGYPGTYGEWDAPCMDCKRARWHHWLRALREQLAETERERGDLSAQHDRDTVHLKRQDSANIELRKANTRLREALEEVTYEDNLDRAVMIATAALARTQPKEED